MVQLDIRDIIILGSSATTIGFTAILVMLEYFVRYVKKLRRRRHGIETPPKRDSMEEPALAYETENIFTDAARRCGLHDLLPPQPSPQRSTTATSVVEGLEIEVHPNALCRTPTKSAHGTRVTTAADDAAIFTDDPLQNIPSPPAPVHTIRRSESPLGTQAPRAALLAARSNESLRSRLSHPNLRPARTWQSPSSQSTGASSRSCVPKGREFSRGRADNDTCQRSPSKATVRPDSVIEPVPPIPAEYASPRCIRTENTTSNSNVDQSSRPRICGRYKLFPTQPNIGPPPSKALPEVSKSISLPQTTAESAFTSHRKDNTKEDSKRGFLFDFPLHRTDSNEPQIPLRASYTGQRARTPRISVDSLADSIRTKLSKRKSRTEEDEEARLSAYKAQITGPSMVTPQVEEGHSPRDYTLLHGTEDIVDPQITSPDIDEDVFTKGKAKTRRWW